MKKDEEKRAEKKEEEESTSSRNKTRQRRLSPFLYSSFAKAKKNTSRKITINGGKKERKKRDR